MGHPIGIEVASQLVEGFRFTRQQAPQTSVFNTNTFWLNLSVLEDPPSLTWFAVQKNVDDTPVIQFERLVGEVTAHVDAQYVRVDPGGIGISIAPVKTPEDLERRRADIMEIWAARSAES